MADKLRARMRQADAGLLILILGGSTLILLGLLTLAIIPRQAPPLAPPTTPEGVVPRFYLAAYNGNSTRAYSYLSQDARQRISADDLEQQLGSELRGSRIQVGMSKVQDDSAKVEVAITRFGPIGTFGPEEWTKRRDVYLQREADTWKITGEAFQLLPKELPVTR